MRLAALALVALAASQAPMQCASEPAHEERRWETPGEALYALAQQFRARGDEAAWRATLEYLVAKYPSSREARRARTELDAARAEAGAAP